MNRSVLTLPAMAPVSEGGNICSFFLSLLHGYYKRRIFAVQTNTKTHLPILQDTWLSKALFFFTLPIFRAFDRRIFLKSRSCRHPALLLHFLHPEPC